MDKALIYYTDCRLDPAIMQVCQEQLKNSFDGEIVSVSLNKSIDFGKNIVLEGEKHSYPTMVKQIIMALEASTGKYVFFCEHDVLYPKSHFNFTPFSDDIFYYNSNVWRWKLLDDKAITYDRMLPLSVMCCNRQFALDHYRMRAKKIEELGWHKERSREPRWVRRIGYEPGTKKKKRGGLTDDDFGTWYSETSVIDIRHKKSFSRPKISLDEFKHEPNNWQEKSIKEIKEWSLASLFPQGMRYS